MCIGEEGSGMDEKLQFKFVWFHNIISDNDAIISFSIFRNEYGSGPTVRTASTTHTNLTLSTNQFWNFKIDSKFSIHNCNLEVYVFRNGDKNSCCPSQAIPSWTNIQLSSQHIAIVLIWCWEKNWNLKGVMLLCYFGSHSDSNDLLGSKTSF